MQEAQRRERQRLRAPLQRPGGFLCNVCWACTISRLFFDCEQPRSTTYHSRMWMLRCRGAGSSAVGPRAVSSSRASSSRRWAWTGRIASASRTWRRHGDAQLNQLNQQTDAWTPTNNTMTSSIFSHQPTTTIVPSGAAAPPRGCTPPRAAPAAGPPPRQGTPSRAWPAPVMPPEGSRGPGSKAGLAVGAPGRGGPTA